ncbi:protein translocase subunit SecF [Vibrio caribbeanicus]|uniref:Protein-export membrane protein SecF n=1 Tax=Vibrio caribbeanicus ATCC BAA-2122 TaxID=796620 RepID=E3BML4_9VIBR|nr:protein translocase subunit SecF [Vibrio caribbeanicus]EFP95759.1 preprotein translocase subunit SecF [Vibrio caribbeanicus ATCC BAA-2122]
MSAFFKQRIREIRSITSIISLVLMIISLGALATNGLNMGLDFTGGMVTEVKVDNSISHEKMVETLQPALGQFTNVTHADQAGRWMVRYPIPAEGEQTADLVKVLSPISNQVEVISNSMVGSQVGQDLIDQGGLALMISMLSILGYLCFRFEWRLASGSLLALLHDVVLVLGFFAASQMEFNLTVFAAILAILGYSLNDSIIIADRIRELLLAKQELPIEKINDDAVIATFSRTMVTSGTTLLTVSALWIMGGAALQGFSIAMFIGILSGTWSSISIGTVLPEWLKLEPKHYLPVEIDSAP